MSALACLLLGLWAAPEHAAHHGQLAGDDTLWTTVIVGDLGAGERLPLAATLPAETELEEPAGFSLSRDGARRVDALVVRAGHVRVRGRLRVPRDPRAAGVPLLAGPIPQRVAVETGPLGFVPDEALGLEPHVGYRASAAVDARTRDRLDAAYPELPAPGPAALYLDGSQSLVGTWAAPGVSLAVTVAVASAFAAAVAGMLAALRRLSRRAAAERAEALLREELGGL